MVCWASVTDSGPPERITPRGLNARTSSSEISQGCISQYTPNSRTRRAISWVYCAPKSRIRIRWAWMSACETGEAVGRATLAICALVPGAGSEAGQSPASSQNCELRDPVIRGLFGNADVVHVTFTNAGVCDAH